MRDEVNFIARSTRDMTRGSFLRDETLKRAVARSLEVTCVAAHSFPEDVRATLPRVPWRSLDDMRDPLLRDCGGLDYNWLWDFISINAAEISAALRAVLEN